MIFKLIRRLRRDEAPPPPPPRREDNSSMADLVRLLQSQKEIAE